MKVWVARHPNTPPSGKRRGGQPGPGRMGLNPLHFCPKPGPWSRWL